MDLKPVFIKAAVFMSALKTVNDEVIGQYADQPRNGICGKKMCFRVIVSSCRKRGKEGRIFPCLSKMIWLGNFGKFSLLKEAKTHCGLK